MIKLKIINEVLQSEKKADELLEKANREVEKIAEETRTKEAELKEQGRKKVEDACSDCVGKMVSEAVKKAKEEAKQMELNAQKRLSAARTRIPGLIGQLTKEVEKL